MPLCRNRTLQLIQKVTIEFVRQVSKRTKELSTAAVNAAGGKIFTFGSYRLGVYGPGELPISWDPVHRLFVDCD